MECVSGRDRVVAVREGLDIFITKFVKAQGDSFTSFTDIVKDIVGGDNLKSVDLIRGRLRCN